MGIRRQAREIALQMLYQADLGSLKSDREPLHFWEENTDPEALVFARELVRGVRLNLEKIDTVISKNSQNWKISRMAAVDKNILRLAVYSFLYRPDIPVKVTINEAVEIAKRYGTSESGAFVNGILDNIAKQIKIEDESK